MTRRHRECRSNSEWEVYWVPVWVSLPIVASTGNGYREHTPMWEERVQKKVKIGYVQEPTVTVWKLPNKNGLFYQSRLHVDADGAPNAYHPKDTPGLDALSNAGYSALVRDRAGRPVKQTASDPYPGFYISSTSLQDYSKKERDTKRYVDARNFPYIVLPGKRYKEWGVQLGDLGAAVNLKNGKMSYAVFADEGPTKKIGEGSMALARALGLNEDPRRGGTEGKDIFYLVFPGSGRGQGTIPTVEEINQRGASLFAAWGGMDQIKALSVEMAGRLNG